MSRIDDIVQTYSDEEFLTADGFDRAIIGVDDMSMRIIYSTRKCIEILMEEMSEEDALEHFSYNVTGAYVGEKAPIWCVDDFYWDEDANINYSGPEETEEEKLEFATLKAMAFIEKHSKIRSLDDTMYFAGEEFSREIAIKALEKLGGSIFL